VCDFDKATNVAVIERDKIASLDLERRGVAMENVDACAGIDAVFPEALGDCVFISGVIGDGQVGDGRRDREALSCCLI
jgi:hypothetical protein